MQLVFSRYMDQRYYYAMRPVHASLYKTTKEPKIEELKSKAKEAKDLNSSLRPN